ncbi:MAG: phosphodiester glycosidase family protein, partial [Candidatus Sericytochromatia bacterium]
MSIPPPSSQGLRPPAELFGKRRLPPLSELLPVNQGLPAVPAAKPALEPVNLTAIKPADQNHVSPLSQGKTSPQVQILDKGHGKPLATGVWYDASRRSADGGVVRVLTVDPHKAELVPIFKDHAPVSGHEIEADKQLLGAINASFFGKGIIGDIKSDKKVSTDDHLPALDKITDQRHFIASGADGRISTGRGGMSENAAAGYRNFIGGFPALYTRDQLRNLDQDIRSGAFAKRASYGGANQADSVSRSFIGIAADGKVLLVAAGHGSERGKGVSMAEGARLLRELGA